ncbi:hypothetical protein K525DRAFT_189736 [Schizophyllum commune Loenen D]|nr:hypothetical protein K525DRAFT_189736 [Schizophyllum commune Loenen D]
MEHLADEWSDRGIRSIFAFRPEAPGFDGTRYSPPTGLGWRFSAEHAMGEHTYTLKFDAFFVHTAYLGTLIISPEDIQIDNMLPIQTDNMVCHLPFVGWKNIGTWLVVDPTKLATISFLVSQACPPGRMDWGGEEVDRSILIRFPTTVPPQAASPPPSAASSASAPLGTSLGDRALVRSLDVGMGDHTVQFQLPFKVRSRRAVDTRPVYAIRDVCKAIGLSVCEASERSGMNPEPASQEYDYDTDSDIDDDGADTENEDQPPTPSFFFFFCSVSDDNDDSGGDAAATAVDALGDAHSATVINVKHHAHRTWKAFVFYLYTGKIAFKKLTSAEDAGSVTSPASPLECSPKSMYAIAEKAKMDDLRALCIQAIMADITVKNVAQEVFGKFSSKYPEVLEAETDFLVKHLKDSKCAEEVQRVMQNAAAKPHYGTAVAMVWRKMAT